MALLRDLSKYTQKYEQFSVLNFSNNFYYPDESLIKSLKDIIIFDENKMKHDIPNGSVFSYEKGREYIPSILGSDIGCGIACAVIDHIDLNDNKNIDSVLSAVNSVGIHIGQGNHFLDITSSYPLLEEKSGKDLLFIHSDFNNKNIIPKNFIEAKDMEKKSKDARANYIDKLSKKLQLKCDLYMDWTHNSVKFENDSVVYRKGSINLNDNDGTGILGLNPYDGLLLYNAKFKRYNNSMQHGTGRCGSKSNLFDYFTKHEKGIARGYSFGETDHLGKEFQHALKSTYNDHESFLKNYLFEMKYNAKCESKLAITTKKSN